MGTNNNSNISINKTSNYNQNISSTHKNNDIENSNFYNKFSNIKIQVVDAVKNTIGRYNNHNNSHLQVHTTHNNEKNNKTINNNINNKKHHRIKCNLCDRYFNIEKFYNNGKNVIFGKYNTFCICEWIIIKHGVWSFKKNITVINQMHKPIILKMAKIAVKNKAVILHFEEDCERKFENIEIPSFNRHDKLSNFDNLKYQNDEFNQNDEHKKE